MNMNFDKNEVIKNLLSQGIPRNTLHKLLFRIQEIKRIPKNKVKIIIFEKPEGASRPKFRRMGNFIKVYVPENSINSKKTRKYVKNLITEEFGENFMIYTGCSLKCDAYIKTPSSFSTVDTILAELGFIKCINRPDWDNIGKTTDLFNYLLWLDDKLVHSATVNKRFSLVNRVEFEIEFELGFDSKYNKNNIKKSKMYKNIENDIQVYD